MTPAQHLVERLDELGRVSDEPQRLARTFLSPAMRKANALVGAWMAEAGLAVREDAVGNLIGRWAAANPGAKTFLLGSHLDTVRDAGRFDGPLGVLVALAAVEELRARRVRLPFHLEIVGFSEEEGVRFASAYLGSKGFTGALTEDDLARRDEAGVSVRQALETHHGKPFTLPAPAHHSEDLLGYFEVHIEQGPVLEAEDLALGVVSAIAGQSRLRLTWRGQAGHAGTTPMRLRRDALAGAAEFVLAVEAQARRLPALVATVGALEVAPGAANVIPGEVIHTLDMRHARDDARRAGLRHLERAARRIAAERCLELAWEPTQENPATPCTAALAELLAASVEAHQGRCPLLASGAGHDGVILAAQTAIVMLFVRCKGGLSHHPDEYASPADIAAALTVTVDFLERLAAKVRGG